MKQWHIRSERIERLVEEKGMLWLSRQFEVSYWTIIRWKRKKGQMVKPETVERVRAKWGEETAGQLFEEREEENLGEVMKRCS